MSDVLSELADPAAQGVDPEALEALFERTAKTVRIDPLCAAQVAVARHGKLVGFRTFGSARFGGEVREADESSLFAVFSVTKAFVSAASWILLQEGKLALDDRVSRWIPGFERDGKQGITVEHLLTHTAGMPSAGLEPRVWPDREARLRAMGAWPLEWEPGTRFVYHGQATMLLLAEIISQVAGIDYRDFVRTRIFEPLGIDRLFIGLPDAHHADVAEVLNVGEVRSSDGRSASPVDAPVIGESLLAFANDRENRAIGSPGGGGIGRAADVALFYQGILCDAAGTGAGIWRPETLESAWTVRHPDLIDPMVKQPATRGLGVVMAGETGRIWRGFAEECSARAFGHMGAGGQVAWADPESGLSFAYCTNGAQRDPARQGATGIRLSHLAASSIG